MIRLRKFLSSEGKKMINSYFMANFDSNPLVWMFSNAASLKKIENLQKQVLSFSCKSYNTSYEDLLLKSGFSSMNVKRLRTPCVEIFKILKNLNPSFKKQVFSLRQTDRQVRQKNKLKLDVPSYNQLALGKKALTFFDLKTWNSLPYFITYAENLTSFKTMIKFWNGKTCTCKIYCKKFFFR